MEGTRQPKKSGSEPKTSASVAGFHVFSDFSDNFLFLIALREKTSKTQAPDDVFLCAKTHFDLNFHKTRVCLTHFGAILRMDSGFVLEYKCDFWKVRET